METSGEVLHGDQLDSMASCLANVNLLLPSDSSEQSNWAGLTMSASSEQQHSLATEEIDRLEQQLKQLNLRKDQLILQSLSGSEELADITDVLQTEKSNFLLHQKAAFNAAQEHAMALAKLAETTDKLADVFKNMHQVFCNIYFFSTNDFVTFIYSSHIFLVIASFIIFNK